MVFTKENAQSISLNMWKNRSKDTLKSFLVRR